MLTMRIVKTFDPGRLHTELQTAGIPIVTVRASFPDIAGPAVYGVVVLEDRSDLKKVEALIKAHRESRTPSRQPDPKGMELALREMEKF